MDRSALARYSPYERFGLILKALGIVAVLILVKYVVATQGWEIILTLPVLTGLMGAVVFTLAILMAGVLADFKESEKIVGELASLLRRYHKDVELILREPGPLRAVRGHIRDLVKVLNANFRKETNWKLGEIYRPIDAIDAAVSQAAAAGAPPNYVTALRQSMSSITRIVNRIETIIETTFIPTAYYVAGIVVATSLTAFLFANIEPLHQALFLYGFGAFLLIGLFLLISDLDNPFAGFAKIDLRQMQKLEAFVDAEAGVGGAPPSPVAARATNEESLNSASA